MISERFGVLITTLPKRHANSFYDGHRGGCAATFSLQAQGVRYSLLLSCSFGDLPGLQSGCQQEICSTSAGVLIDDKHFAIQKQELEAVLLCDLVGFCYMQRCSKQCESITCSTEKE